MVRRARTSHVDGDIVAELGLVPAFGFKQHVEMRDFWFLAHGILVLVFVRVGLSFSMGLT